MPKHSKAQRRLERQRRSALNRAASGKKTSGEVEPPHEQPTPPHLAPVELARGPAQATAIESEDDDDLSDRTAQPQNAIIVRPSGFQNFDPTRETREFDTTGQNADGAKGRSWPDLLYDVARIGAVKFVFIVIILLAAAGTATLFWDDVQGDVIKGAKDVWPRIDYYLLPFLFAFGLLSLLAIGLLLILGINALWEHLLRRLFKR